MIAAILDVVDQIPELKGWQSLHAVHIAATRFHATKMTCCHTWGAGSDHSTCIAVADRSLALGQPSHLCLALQLQ